MSLVESARPFFIGWLGASSRATLDPRIWNKPKIPCNSRVQCLPQPLAGLLFLKYRAQYYVHRGRSGRWVR